ncbi:MAG: hypothetical protein IMX02_10255 [Limnochordaceae bacterium]|nr:hypothetical protein [Limnochordaceae bacterium]
MAGRLRKLQEAQGYLDERWQQAILVDADNVARYIYEELPQDRFFPEDFPACVPPWEISRVEWSAPRRSLQPDGQAIELPDMGVRKYGTFAM